MFNIYESRQLGGIHILINKNLGVIIYSVIICKYGVFFV